MKHILIYKNITIDLECNINSHIQNDNIFPYVEKYYKNYRKFFIDGNCFGFAKRLTEAQDLKSGGRF